MVTMRIMLVLTLILSETPTPMLLIILTMLLPVMRTQMPLKVMSIVKWTLMLIEKVMARLILIFLRTITLNETPTPMSLLAILLKVLSKLPMMVVIVIETVSNAKIGTVGKPSRCSGGSRGSFHVLVIIKENIKQN